jgi:glycosyltransferase involved in cell wall biosynthesis
MKISIIIPTYNRAKLLERAIISVLSQTYQEYELIVVDDGSEDETKEVCERFQNVHYLYQENRGVSSARNRGVVHAKYEWIAFLDSDDTWMPTKLERQATYHHNNRNSYISQTQESWMRQEKAVKAMDKRIYMEEGIFKACVKQCIVGASTVLIHKRVFEEVGLFDEAFEVCEDYELWIRIAKKFDIALLDEALIVKHGGREDQLSTKHWGMDRWRIDALLKNIDGSEYDNTIKEEIIKKATIICKGAQKRDNSVLLEKYEKIIKEL